MRDFELPVTRDSGDELFTGSAPELRVQSVAERHEYKKKSGSSDGAQTYDTTAT